MRTAITIVLNGLHHLKNQIQTIPLEFDRWIIIEGASDSTHCTSWCNRMEESFHKNGHSIDGTYEFLRDISHPKIDIYFKQGDGLWDGKVSMLNFGLQSSKPESGYLWQIDVDEYWKREQFGHAEEILRNTNCVAACFLCDNLLTPNIVVRGSWGEGKDGNYRRLFAYEREDIFESHEPPVLKSFLKKDKIRICPPSITPRFEHLSYFYDTDVKFKSSWYKDHQYVYDNWKDIVSGKQKLPMHIKEFFGTDIPEVWNDTVITYR